MSENNFSTSAPLPALDKALFDDVDGKPPGLWLALDCASRMKSTWPYACTHFLNSPSFTADAQWLYLKLIYAHALRLKAALANPDRSGDHVSTESFALYTIAVLCPELKKSTSWPDFALSRLSREIEQLQLSVPIKSKKPRQLWPLCFYHISRGRQP